MIQDCRISDAVLGVLLNRPGGENLVDGKSVSQDHGNPRSATARFWMDVVTKGSNRITRVCRQGTAPSVLASARELSGPGAWELDRLYVDGWDPYCLEPVSGAEAAAGDTILELLDGLMQECLERGAHRVFLRCPAGSALVSAVRRLGFYPIMRETVLEGNSSRHAVPQIGQDLCVRERLPQDTMGLFQLFTVATPQPVRTGLGFTLDQWLEAQMPGSSRQLVVSHGDRITGWVGIRRGDGRTEVESLVHPDRPEVACLLLETASDCSGLVLWRVPEHQESVRAKLLDQGFREGGPIAVLVKTARAQKYSYTTAAVEAWG